MKNNSFAISPYRLIALIALIALSPYRLFASSSEVHRFGCFNIRYITTEDAGAKQWSNRKNRVLQIVTDYDFDICGFNEVTGTNNNGTLRKQADGTTCNQKEDLINGLSATYNSIAYEREGGLYEHNVLSYKKAKYECLENYPLYMNDHPLTPGISWTSGTENPMARVAVVAHMKVKATGQQFWACCVHTNYGLYEAGIKSARLLAEHLKEKAGEEPIILVGDLNLNRENQPEAYRGYVWAFEEARLSAETIQCLPTTNPSVTCTTNGWKPASSSSDGSEYDHLFYHNMRCKAYHIITEVYGQSTTPSDHFPLQGEFELVYDHPTAYYASNETELNNAIQQANPQDTIFLQKGELSLSEPLNPNKSLVFIGGYNKVSKTYEEGEKTMIKVANTQQTPVAIDKWYSIELHNIILSEYRSATTRGGGAVYCPGHLLRMRNCEVSDCYSQTTGGGVMANVNRLDIANCVFLHNAAKNNGGAITTSAYETLRLFDNVFQNDSSASGSAVAVLACETANVQRSSFIGNISTKHGTFYCVSCDATKSVNFLNCAFLNNVLNATSGLSTLTKLFGGAAINVNMATSQQKVNVGLCAMIGNKVTFTGTKDFTGAALNIYQGNACVMDNLMVGNTCTMAGATQAADMYNAITPWRFTKNVLTDSLSAPGNLPNTLGGSWNNGQYTVFVTSKHTYQLKQTSLCDYNLKCLPTNQRMCETAFEFDLNEDGNYAGYISTDMLLNSRGVLACIGAVEYTGEIEPETGLENVNENVNVNANRKVMRNGQIIIDNKYTLQGQSL